MDIVNTSDSTSMINGKYSSVFSQFLFIYAKIAPRGTGKDDLKKKSFKAYSEMFTYVNFNAVDTILSINGILLKLTLDI